VSHGGGQEGDRTTFRVGFILGGGKGTGFSSSRLTSVNFGPLLSVIPTLFHNHKKLKLSCSLVGGVPKFRRNIRRLISALKMEAVCSPGTLVLLPDCMVLQHRKPQYQMTNRVLAALCVQRSTILLRHLVKVMVRLQ